MTMESCYDADFSNGPLVKSVTQDEDDLPRNDHHHPTVMNPARYQLPMKQQSETRLDTFYVHYEKMVRQQETEDSLVRSYMDLILKEIISARPLFQDQRSTSSCLVTLYASDFQTALESMERNPQHPLRQYTEVDAQLEYVLRTYSEGTSGNSGVDSNDNMPVCWDEVIQCYKACVAGMQALENVGRSKSNRSRVRSRSMQIMALFKPVQCDGYGRVGTKSVKSTVPAEKASAKRRSACRNGYMILCAFLVGHLFSFPVEQHIPPQLSVQVQAQANTSIPICNGALPDMFSDTNIITDASMDESNLPNPNIETESEDDPPEQFGLEGSHQPNPLKASVRSSAVRSIVLNEMKMKSGARYRDVTQKQSQATGLQTLENPPSSIVPISIIAGATAAGTLLVPAVGLVLNPATSPLIAIGTTVVLASFVSQGIRTLASRLFERIRRKMNMQVNSPALA